MSRAAARPLTLAVFAGDVWQHVCPRLRLLGPAGHAGLTVLRGNDWQGDEPLIYPEVVGQADLVITQRDFPRHTAAYEAVTELARQAGKPLVYELDDLLIELSSEHPDTGRYRTAYSHILQAVVEADAVTAATPALVNSLRPFNPNIRLLPNYLDDALWPLSPPGPTAEAGRPVVIGYMGGHSHRADVDMIAPALQQVLAEAGAGVLLRFWGIAPPPALAGLPNVQYIPLGLIDYGEFAAYFAGQQCDIFIAPLQDNPFNRCKSPLKFLEYSALGVPGVYSAIEPYAGVVVHGSNGYLAETASDWAACLNKLLADPALRRRLGAAAFETVRENWRLSQHAHQWPEAYRQIMAQAEPRPRSAVVNALRLAHKWQLDLEQELASRNSAIQTLQAQAAAQEQVLQNLRAHEQTLKAQVAQREAEVQELTAQLSEVKHSLGWQMLQRMRRVRRRVAPRGSLRERPLNLAIQAARLWRAGGPGAVARRAWARVAGRHNQPSGASPNSQGQDLQFRVEAGQPCPLPAISVMVWQTGANAEPPLEAVTTWVNRQTFPETEVIVWAKENGTAHRLSAAEEAWAVDSWEDLRPHLRGRYVCLASPDLLGQPATYLETNLIALETEQLAFTVNLAERGPWIRERLEAGFLPGEAAQPLLRLVARTDCVQADLGVDLSGWAAPAVAGKVIQVTPDDGKQPEALPFGLGLGRALRLGQEGRLSLQRQVELNEPAAPHLTHPVDTVVPASLTPADKPTVLIALSYLAVGGAERVALDMMRRLQSDIRFVVVTVEYHDPALGTTAEAFRQITPYVYQAPDFLAGHLTYSMFAYLIDRFQPAALYIANGATWIYDALSTLRANYPGLRLINQVYDHQAGWINRYDATIVSSLDAHIGVNERIGQAYRDHGVLPERVHIIEHGVDPLAFNPADYPEQRRRALKDSLGLPADRRVVTFVSRLHPQKRPMDFVELARRSAADASLVFLLVGDGPLAAVVEEEIARLKLKNIIRRPFYRPSSDILAISEVVVLPSEYEGMPVVLLEAQAMGKPVVATDVGNNREILDATGGGVVVANIGDAAGLQEGVKRVLAQPPNPADLRAKVLAIADLARIAKKYRCALLGDGHA